MTTMQARGQGLQAMAGWRRVALAAVLAMACLASSPAAVLAQSQPGWGVPTCEDCPYREYTWDPVTVPCGNAWFKLYHGVEIGYPSRDRMWVGAVKVRYERISGTDIMFGGKTIYFGSSLGAQFENTEELFKGYFYPNSVTNTFTFRVDRWLERASYGLQFGWQHHPDWMTGFASLAAGGFSPIFTGNGPMTPSMTNLIETQSSVVKAQIENTAGAGGGCWQIFQRNLIVDADLPPEHWTPPTTVPPTTPPTTVRTTTTSTTMTTIPRPTAPTNVRSTRQTTDSISLAWNASQNATKYTIQATPGPHDYDAGAATSFVAGGLESNTLYSIVVCAVGPGGTACAPAIFANTLPTYRAQLREYTATTTDGGDIDLARLRPEQEATITFVVANVGSATWQRGGTKPVLLGTDVPRDRASAFAGPGWISPTRPAALVEASVPPNGLGTFRFTIVAPPAGRGTYRERFNLVSEGNTWFETGDFGFTATVIPIVGAASTPNGDGYWGVATDGGIFGFGTAKFYGSMGDQRMNAPAVGMAALPKGAGYWIVSSDGGIFSFGDAGFHGSAGNVALSKPVVGMASTPSGRGYWLVAADGGVFNYGDAGFFDSMGGKALSKPITGIAGTPTGKGYWLVGADGGVFAFGDAKFFGSTGNVTLNAPVVGIAGTPSGKGYWIAAADGGVFAFGDAPFRGSFGGDPRRTPMVAIMPMPGGVGYRLVDAAGNVFTFGPPKAITSGAVMPPNSYLPKNARITSPKGNAYMVHQPDGNVVVYGNRRTGWKALWATDTAGSATASLNMQADGNLVLYGAGALWASGTYGDAMAWLEIQDDCNLVLYAPGRQAIWATRTTCNDPVVGSGATLGAEVPVYSNNGQAMFKYQGDGNVVLYRKTSSGGWKAIWSTGTSGKASSRLTMQTDGNLVLYNGNTKVWASDTPNNAGSVLVIQDDCNAVIYAKNNRAIWSSRTNCAS